MPTTLGIHHPFLGAPKNHMCNKEYAKVYLFCTTSGAALSRLPIIYLNVGTVQLYIFMWATDEITCWGTCHHQMLVVPYRFCSFWIWIIYGVSVLGGPQVVMKVSLNRFKVQGNFLLLCSSTNFVDYSYMYLQDCTRTYTHQYTSDTFSFKQTTSSNYQTLS